ncbi:hypothetical protein RB653_001951 [Dictyostelium firmibasis]|uniref:Uncharacterized protein n=1 Tax=Dictyostelium firmibasis TaxID=79012 RepID=A0AAN7TPU0_9MYCE
MSNSTYRQEIKEYKERETKEIKEIKERSIADLNKKKSLIDRIYRLQLKVDAETGVYFGTTQEKTVYYILFLILCIFSAYNFLNILLKSFL